MNNGGNVPPPVSVTMNGKNMMPGSSPQNMQPGGNQPVIAPPEGPNQMNN